MRAERWVFIVAFVLWVITLFTMHSMGEMHASAICVAAGKAWSVSNECEERKP